MSKNKKIISVREFSEIYGFCLRYSYVLANSEGFPMIKTGKKINILADKVDQWLEENIGKQF